MGKELPQYANAENLFFKLPLYQTVEISSDELFELHRDGLKVDGYCPYCRKPRVFARDKPGWVFDQINTMSNYDMVFYDLTALHCSLVYEHTIKFLLRIQKSTISKIGQYPSFADIALDESKEYGELLGDEDSSEFHKAIGLAAHGVGIGSYVYLRRIFERLIQKRFDEFKVAESWDVQEYQKLRMNERIEFLRGHLPEFLVRNRKIYSILSLGIHELDEVTCLNFFEVLRTSTVVILEEDKKKQEELDRQKALEKAIATFEHPREASSESGGNS
jgi:hypothetical protein